MTSAPLYLNCTFKITYPLLFQYPGAGPVQPGYIQRGRAPAAQPAAPHPRAGPAAIQREHCVRDVRHTTDARHGCDEGSLTG